jgi:hypothetical protein
MWPNGPEVIGAAGGIEPPTTWFEVRVVGRREFGKV